MPAAAPQVESRDKHRRVRSSTGRLQLATLEPTGHAIKEEGGGGGGDRRPDGDDGGHVPGEVAAARLRVLVQQPVHRAHQRPHALVVGARNACATRGVKQVRTQVVKACIGAKPAGLGHHFENTQAACLAASEDCSYGL